MKELICPSDHKTTPRQRRNASALPSTSLAQRRAKAALIVALALVAAISTPVAHATDPTTQTSPNPFSWAQFKQNYAVSLSGDSFVLSMTSTPTVLYGSVQAGTPTSSVPNTGTLGSGLGLASQQPGFLLGDFRELDVANNAVPNDPPGPTGGEPSNVFRDTSFTSWTSPNNYVVASASGNIASSGRASSVTIDDSFTAASGFTTAPAASWTPGTGVGFDAGGYSVNSQTTGATPLTTATWSFSKATTPTLYDGQWDVYVYIPTIGTGENRVTNAQYTVAGVTATVNPVTVDQTINLGTFVRIGGPFIVDSTAGMTVTLSNANQTGTYSLVADAVQLRPDGNTVDDGVVDNPAVPGADIHGSLIFNAVGSWVPGATSDTTDQFGLTYLTDAPTNSTANTNVDDNAATFTNGTYSWAVSTDKGGANGTTYHTLDLTNVATTPIVTHATAQWALTAPLTGTTNVYVYIPPVPSGGGPWLADAHYTVTDSTTSTLLATIIINQAQNAGQFVLLASGISVAAGDQIAVNLIDTTTSAGILVADLAQLRNADVVTWKPNVPAAGQYSLYAWFPSEATAGISDAHYTASVNGAAVVESRVNQANGGTWTYIGGPFAVSPTDKVVVQLDNTSLDSASLSGSKVVAADAIQLRAGGNGAGVFGSPVAVNVTDYPELISDANTTPATSGVVGGHKLNYIAPLALNGAIDATNNVYTFTGGAANDNTAKTFPIDQVVYYTRTEDITTASGGVEVVGAVYCADGLNGNVIWRYPNLTTAQSELPSTIASSPIFIRQIMVRVTAPSSSTGGDIYQPRDVIVVGDSNGKLFCLDAAGEGDGNDTVVDDTNVTPVSFNSSGQPITGDGNSLHTIKVGTTDCYWVWQPNANQPIARDFYSEIIDDNNANNTVNTQFSAAAPWTSIAPSTVVGVYGGSYYRALPPVNVTPTPVTGKVIWRANPATTLTTGVSCYVYVSHPSPTPSTELHVTDANYVVYDSGGTAHKGCSKGSTLGVDQTTVGGFEQLYDSTGTVPLIVTMDTTGSAGGTKNCVTLDNTTAATAANTYVVADAVRIQAINSLKERDPNADLIVPADYRLNSVTPALIPDQNVAGAFDATLFVGNSNGVLYSVDASGTFSNPFQNASTTNSGPFTAVDPSIYDLSLDPLFPTVRVNWWFNTGGGIAYSPAYDPTNNYVYVTSYDPEQNNLGRLFAINNWFGPVGNGGLSYNATTGALSGPGSFDYNVNPVPEWSFPDGYGTKHAFATTGSPVLGTIGLGSTNDHWLQGDGTLKQISQTGVTTQPLQTVTSKVTDPTNATTDQVACLPLGDIAGAPTLFTNGGTTRIYITANDPVSSINGRVMAVDESGNFIWSYPSTQLNPKAAFHTSNDPNTVNDTISQIGDTAGNPGVFTTPIDSATGNATAPQIGAFTEELQSPTWFVSSSPAMGKITFPTALPATTVTALGTAAANSTVPMLYTGDTDGILYALQAQDGATLLTDDQRLIYNLPILDASPIYSTPALLGGSSTAASGAANVGGVVFLTTSTNDLVEIEATPYLFTDTTSGTTSTVVNTDVDFTGPGGLSSPALAGFDITPLTASSSTPVAVASSTLPRIRTNVFEWLYCGSDLGPLYGVSARASIGGGGGTGGFDTGTYTPPNIDNTPPLQTVDLTRNLITAVSAQPVSATTVNWTDPTDYGPGITNGNQAINPVFEWGQTVYIKVYGLENPLGTGVTPSGGTADPRFLSCTFTLSTVGTGGRVSRVETQTITPDVLKKVNFAATGTGAMPASIDGSYVGVFAYKLGNGDDRSQTPGSKVRITNVTETILLDGRVQIVKARIDTGTVVRNASGTLAKTTPVDQATFGILNPLAVRGGSQPLDGTVTVKSVGLHPATVTLSGNQTTVGPFQSFDSVTQPVFTGTNGYQMADGNGNNIPSSAPSNGTATVAGGGGVVADPTKSLSQQTQDPVTFAMVVATGTRLTSDGASTDNGIPGVTIDPGFTGYTREQPDPTAFGMASLNIADRSALGTTSWFLDRFRTSSPKQGWNDDSGRNGPGSVINPLPWDAMPQAYYMGGGNTSTDYPDIPDNHISVQLLSRKAPASNTGSTGDTTKAAAQLSAGAGTTNVYPQALDVQVDIPRFQPANLEEYDPSSGYITNGVTRANANGANVPHGYVGAARVFVDSNNDGRWSPGEAYRIVQVWTGVQADMATVIQEPTTDTGRIAPGVGIENPFYNAADNMSSEWSPFAANSSSLSLYSPYYQPVTVRALTNVNLVNVHFDQFLNYYSVDSSGNLSSVSKPVYLPLTSDETADTSLIPSVDSLASLGSISDGILTSSSSSGRFAMPILRTSADFFSPSATYDHATGIWSGGTTSNPALMNVYRPNGSLLDSGGNYLFPGPTLHKPRPGDDPIVGSYWTTPDEPHDAAHPMNDGTPAGPLVSVAVPLGTPVGTYSTQFNGQGTIQTLRAFEGSDPITASTTFKGPTYGGLVAPFGSNPSPYTGSNVAQEYSMSILQSAATGSVTPGQAYSDPGTVVKVEVIEAPLTGVSPSHIPTDQALPRSGSLPHIDGDIPDQLPASANVSSLPSGADTPSSNNIQPWAFPASNMPLAFPPSSIGLLWTSSRYDWDGRTDKYNYPFDIFASSVPTTREDGTLNSSGVTVPGWGTVISKYSTRSSGLNYWWTAPTPMTYPTATGATAAQAYDPFVLEPVLSSTRLAAVIDSTSPTGINWALYISSSTKTSTGTAPTTIYSLLGRSFSGTNYNFGTPGDAVIITQSSQPMFHPRAVWWTPPSGGTAFMIITWTARVHGKSILMYKVFDPTANNTTGADMALPLTSGLSDVSDATPIPRFLLDANQPSLITASLDCFIDVTYSGRSEASGSTDIFTSRYSVVTPNNSSKASTWTLALQPMAAHGSVMTETLTPSATSLLWRSPDVSWVRDPSLFELDLVNPNDKSTVATIIAPNATNYYTDPASGEWVYRNINITGWNTPPSPTPTIPMTVRINPYSGTVRFSQPPLSTFKLTLVAKVAPMAVRITGTNDVASSAAQASAAGVNSQATVFIDRAPKLSGGTFTTSSGPTHPTVQTARYWYIYRKSALGASVSASVNSTLYMNTRRLTVALPYTIAIDSNGYPSSVQVTASVTPGGSQTTVAVGEYDVDWKRGRIYFAEQYEGCTATVTYSAALSSGGSFVQKNITAPIQWMDEPYTNVPPDSSQPINQNSVGERTVPISTSLNEGEPNAFLDPAAFVMSTHFVDPVDTSSYNGSGVPVNPHRVWLFWTSRRNAYNLHHGYVATTLSSATLAQGTSLMVNGNSTAANIATGMVLHVDTGANEEDVVVAAISGTTLTVGALQKAHAAGVPISNLRSTDYVTSPDSTTSGTTYQYYIPRTVNPGTAAGNNGDWTLYNGNTDVYWEALDPRFEISP